jgi:hypothetical protein
MERGCCLPKETVEYRRNLHSTNHPEYAITLNDLALLFDKLKQYKEAFPRYEEALIIYQRVNGNVHAFTVHIAKLLAAARPRHDRCAARSMRGWSGALDAAVSGIATRSASCSTGHAQAAVQYLPALPCGVD